MATFLEWVERISALAAPPAVGGLIVALALILVARRWLFRVVSMAVMYFVVGVLHTQIIRPEVVLVKLLIGAVVCLALVATGRATSGSATGGEPEWPVPPSRWRRLLRWSDDTPLRALALGAALLAACAGALRFPLPQVPALVGLACYLLGVVGLFLAGMAEEPLEVGLGLLVFLNGFDLFFGALEPSLVVAGLLGLVQFLITLAVAYLALAGAG
ncbi:MAG: hypothetical protein ACK4WK_09600 [Anaerolineae bacterium]